MMKKVYVTTFRKGWIYGEDVRGSGFAAAGGVVGVAVLDLEVKQKVMPLVYYDGCLSGEITPDHTIAYVELGGRSFLVKPGWGTEFVASGAELEVTVPWEVAVELRKNKNKNICPHCGKTIS